MKMTTTKQTLSLIIINLMILTSLCHADDFTRPVSDILIRQDFKIGKKYQYEIERAKIDSRQPGLEKVKSSTNIELFVYANHGNYKECSWKYGSTKITGVDPRQIDEQTKISLNLYEGIEIKFRINEFGTFQEILNFEDCKKQIETAFKKVYDNATQKPTLEERDKIESTLKKSYETPDLLIGTFCPEITILFSLFGEQFNTDSLYNSQSDVPNPFGGRSFPANVLTSIDETNSDIATIVVRQIIPSTELNAIMKETFMELSKKSNKKFDEKEIPTLNISSTLSYDFNFQKSVLNKVSSEKIIEAGGIKQTQILNVILKN